MKPLYRFLLFSEHLVFKWKGLKGIAALVNNSEEAFNKTCNCLTKKKKNPLPFLLFSDAHSLFTQRGDDIKK